MKADLHLHTVLSPCGDLDMSPRNIIAKAKEKGLSVIVITDHNTTRQAPLIHEYGRQQGITVLMGAELNTQEEAHCLAFFPDVERLSEFQKYLDMYLPHIPNNVDKFGYQVQVDINDMIVYEEERLLISAISQSIDALEKEVHRLNGIFIPAHINKSHSSILSQLGFIPQGLNCDALEVSPHITPERFVKDNPYLAQYAIVQFSDAHYLEDIGKAYTELNLSDTSFESVRYAIQQKLY